MSTKLRKHFKDRFYEITSNEFAKVEAAKKASR